MVGAVVALGLLALYLAIVGRGVLTVVLAAALVTLLLLVTFDLDRPTRGLIRVPSTPLTALRAEMALPPAADGPAGARARRSGEQPRGDGARMNLLVAGVVVLVASGLAITALLLVRRNAPEGSYFNDGDRAAGVFGVLATGSRCSSGSWWCWPSRATTSRAPGRSSRR